MDKTEDSEFDFQWCPGASILPLPTAQCLEGCGNCWTNNPQKWVVVASTHQGKAFFSYSHLILIRPACRSLKKR